MQSLVFSVTSVNLIYKIYNDDPKRGYAIRDVFHMVFFGKNIKNVEKNANNIENTNLTKK